MKINGGATAVSQYNVLLVEGGGWGGGERKTEERKTDTHSVKGENVTVREREGERDRDRERDTHTLSHTHTNTHTNTLKHTQTHTHTHTQTHTDSAGFQSRNYMTLRTEFCTQTISMISVLLRLKRNQNMEQDRRGRAKYYMSRSR